MASGARSWWHIQHPDRLDDALTTEASVKYRRPNAAATFGNLYTKARKVTLDALLRSKIMKSIRSTGEQDTNELQQCLSEPEVDLDINVLQW